MLLDVNDLAEGHDFVNIGVFEVSADEGLLAYSVDYLGCVRVWGLVPCSQLPSRVAE